MELDVTHMVEDSDAMPNLSGSIAELGKDAGKITWRNSLEYAKAHPLLADDNVRHEAREYFKGFGAWDEDEIAAWSNDELEALVSQYIAGNIREMEGFDSEEEYIEAEKEGQVSGGLFKSDDGRWYFYLGD